MSMRWMAGTKVAGLACLLVLLLAGPSAWAADDDTAGAAPSAVSDATVDQIRAAIAGETDPELKIAMEGQLELLESGQLDLAKEVNATQGTSTTGGDARTATDVANTLPNGGLVGQPSETGIGGLIGPPVDGSVGGTAGDSLPPEARAELEKLFHEKGNGDPSLDGDVRAEAEKILEKYGVDPREMGSGHEANTESLMHEPDALERISTEGLEHQSPEAREQLERSYADPTVERRELESSSEFETSTHDTPSPEAAEQHEGPAPAEQPETSAPEPSSHEAPESDAPQYEAPQQHEAEYPLPPEGMPH